MADLSYLQITAKEHKAVLTTGRTLKHRQYWADIEVLMSPKYFKQDLHNAQGLWVGPVHTKKFIHTALIFINPLSKAMKIARGPKQTIRSPFSRCEEQLHGEAGLDNSPIPSHPCYPYLHSPGNRHIFALTTLGISRVIACVRDTVMWYSSAHKENPPDSRVV